MVSPPFRHLEGISHSPAPRDAWRRFEHSLFVRQPPLPDGCLSRGQDFFRPLLGYLIVPIYPLAAIVSLVLFTLRFLCVMEATKAPTAALAMAPHRMSSWEAGILASGVLPFGARDGALLKANLPGVEVAARQTSFCSASL
jgi:hypothetical protein